jgi:hypothetical protein
VTSAQRKLARAVEHLATLRDEIREFEDDEAYRFRVDADVRSSREIHYRCVAVELSAPPDHWPLVAGEITQNLRSALDHAVWAAWRDAPNKGDGAHIQYPIFTEPDGFRRRGLAQIVGVPSRVRDLIAQAQPYVTMAEAPSRHPLEMLRMLSNIDKHRTLATVAAAISNQFVGVRPDIDIHWARYQEEPVLGAGETEISVVVATSDGDFEARDVNPGFSYGVRLESLPIGTFVSIAQRVFERITEVETGEPASPFAEYPIYPR